MWKAKDAAAAGRKTLGVDDDSSDEDDEPAKKRRSRGIGVDNPKGDDEAGLCRLPGGSLPSVQGKEKFFAEASADVASAIVAACLERTDPSILDTSKQGC